MENESNWRVFFKWANECDQMTNIHRSAFSPQTSAQNANRSITVDRTYSQIHFLFSTRKMSKGDVYFQNGLFSSFFLASHLKDVWHLLRNIWNSIDMAFFSVDKSKETKTKIFYLNSGADAFVISSWSFAFNISNRLRLSFVVPQGIETESHLYLYHSHAHG